MIDIKSEASLKSYNTFGIDVTAKQLIELTDVNQLDTIDNLEDCLLIGGGSNVLLTTDINKTVVVNLTKGIDVVKENDNHIQLKVASGENWHEFVMYCVASNYGGVENLSLIPGSVGAAPMQNIGAYGVEMKDFLVSVEAIDLKTLESTVFNNEACNFGYRESIFKKGAKGKYFISNIIVELTKQHHKLNTSYGAIQEMLDQKQIVNPTIRDVSEAVIEIRQSKLPDPKELGNAGSFFKNPIIDKDHFEALQQSFPGIKSYPVDSDTVKVPAGWLIESLGWKGKRVGNTGSHAKQALVLVNYGGVEGSEVKSLSEDIKQSVWDTYKIQLETEVNIIS